MNQANEAAGRLRRLYDGNEPYSEVYGIEQTGSGLQERDEQAIVAAYLALTDETPLDEAWLRSVGFEWCAPNGLRLNCMEWHAKWDFRINQYPYPRAPKTRGTIRLLARALGITLTEAKQ